MSNAITALRELVESNARYVALTQRAQDAIAIHPDHARELLFLLDKFTPCSHETVSAFNSTGELYCHDCGKTGEGPIECHKRNSSI